MKLELREDGALYLNGLYSWANIYKAYGLVEDNSIVMEIFNRANGEEDKK